MPYYFVGDEAFPLHKHLNREQQIFNCRLSRGRRCIENAFGILVARFRIFHRVINAYPEIVDAIVRAAVCLHNFIKSNDDANIYCPTNYADHYDNQGNVVDGEWRNGVPKKPALANVRELRRRFGKQKCKQNCRTT